ncbi:Myosin regulatory light chain [Entamoeba marina]
MTTSELIDDYFAIFDRDHDKKISRDQVVELLRALGKAPTAQQEEAILKEVKEDLVGVEKVRQVYKKCEMKLPKDLYDDMFNVFSALDKEENGMIHEAELRQILSVLGRPLKNSEVDAIMRSTTVTREGYVDYKDFCDMLVKEFPPE